LDADPFPRPQGQVKTLIFADKKKKSAFSAREAISVPILKMYDREKNNIPPQ
jgi:hypothetical protein